ncbi:transcriptional regulator [Intrasporangium oryzae NRRL B-24470]|uniref:Transcriptional regulator n=1 Tax=Intrasporangium oryzae NRRL B-24470 TaxID=1386089 RepID=W9GAJ8_9MICO|nr:transcriptional regulator [Intrasporangium oryzae NRRL B-24470]
MSWSVGAVARRVGLPAPTLRSWDRRYGIGPSARTEGNHRRYTAADIGRLRLMSRLTATGVPAQAASEVVRALDDDAVAHRLEADAGSGGSGGSGGDEAGPSASGTADAIVAAAAALDAVTLASLYRLALRQWELTTAWREVLAPALREIGRRWSDGSLGVESEHLASELLQSELRAVVHAHRQRLPGPPVVLATADNEEHHLPLLALDAELARRGISSIFLGSRVPPSAMVGAVRRARPHALFLWASLRRPTSEPLWAELCPLDRPITVVLGGPGWPDNVDVPDPLVTVQRVHDLDSAVQVVLDEVEGPERSSVSKGRVV